MANKSVMHDGMMVLQQDYIKYGGAGPGIVTFCRKWVCRLCHLSVASLWCWDTLGTHVYTYLVAWIQAYIYSASNQQMDWDSSSKVACLQWKYSLIIVLDSSWIEILLICAVQGVCWWSMKLHNSSAGHAQARPFCGINNCVKRPGTVSKCHIL